MKKLIFVFSLLFGAAVAVNAQDSTSTQDQSTQYRTDSTSTDSTSNDAAEPAQSNEAVQTDTASSASQDQSQSMDQPAPANEQPAVSSDNQPSPATQEQSDATVGQDEDADRTEITVAELPATITTQLESTDYSGWTVDKVYKKEKDGQTFYAVKLKQGNEMKKVKFDAQGNVVEEKDKDSKEKHDQ
jgi:hypothetical protein